MKHFLGQCLNWSLIYHFQVGRWKSTRGESYSLNTLLTGKVLILHGYSVFFRSPSSCQILWGFLSLVTFTCVWSRNSNPVRPWDVLGKMWGPSVVRDRGALWSSGMPWQWSIPKVPDRAHCDTSLCFVLISRSGLRVSIRKIYPVDDIPLQPILMANPDCFWGILGWVPGRGGRTFRAGPGFCCEKQYEIPVYACCNQSGMLSNTDHHYSYRAWSILVPKWQRNVDIIHS